jgi:hypothetical protein
MGENLHSHAENLERSPKGKRLTSPISLFISSRIKSQPAGIVIKKLMASSHQQFLETLRNELNLVN